MSKDNAMAAYRKVLSTVNDQEAYEVWTLLTSWCGSRLGKTRSEMTQMVIDSTNPDTE